MNIAVSACLLGTPCRYDGASKPCDVVLALQEDHHIVAVCPEVAGGLRVPHPPSEIVLAKRVLSVVDAEGTDNTDAFVAGAAATLEKVRSEGCRLAVLKAKSPSCGVRRIYDGTFSGTLAAGYGVAARRLREEGVRVIDEQELAACLAASKRRGHVPALLAASSADCPVLTTDRLVLRALTPDDIDDVFAYCSHPDVGPDAGWAPHRTREDSRMFVEEIANAPHVFGLFEKVGEGTGPCVGSVGLIADPQRRNVDCLMLGYALARSVWGRGYMTEAAREVLRYGFQELGLDMISCNHYSFNGRSRRVIEKCGFMHEGTLHGVEATPDGIMRDAELYVLTQERWRALKAKLDGEEAGELNGEASGR